VLYDEQILAQTNANAEVALHAYQNDRGDFSDVMRARIDDLNARIDRVRLQVERAKGFAMLANLGGLSR
jgi:outer membrane protein TolC